MNTMKIELIRVENGVEKSLATYHSMMHRECAEFSNCIIKREMNLHVDTGKNRYTLEQDLKFINQAKVKQYEVKLMFKDKTNNYKYGLKAEASIKADKKLEVEAGLYLGHYGYSPKFEYQVGWQKGDDLSIKGEAKCKIDDLILFTFTHTDRIVGYSSFQHSQNLIFKDTTNSQNNFVAKNSFTIEIVNRKGTLKGSGNLSFQEKNEDFVYQLDGEMENNRITFGWNVDTDLLVSLFKLRRHNIFVEVAYDYANQIELHFKEITSWLAEGARGVSGQEASLDFNLAKTFRSMNTEVRHGPLGMPGIDHFRVGYNLDTTDHIKAEIITVISGKVLLEVEVSGNMSRKINEYQMAGQLSCNLPTVPFSMNWQRQFLANRDGLKYNDESSLFILNGVRGEVEPMVDYS
ncbi:unnamed protein product, partial [Protopolystoma xenopodis]